MHFNPPAPCGAGLSQRGHMRRAEAFSIHPPRAGRDPCHSLHPPNIKKFQSTRPVRGGTLVCVHLFGRMRDFNPPAPCGAGPDELISWWEHECISIHPPRAGRDPILQNNLFGSCEFQSTRPVRGGTSVFLLLLSILLISIHPPRAGRDHARKSARSNGRDFNPPAPCGAGPGRSGAFT